MEENLQTEIFDCIAGIRIRQITRNSYVLLHSFNDIHSEILSSEALLLNLLL